MMIRIRHSQHNTHENDREVTKQIWNGMDFIGSAWLNCSLGFRTGNTQKEWK